MANTKRENMLGKSFGRLKVVSYKGLDESNKRALWKCECDCGNEVVVRKDSLKRGATKSCGCLNKEIQNSFAEKVTTHNLSRHRIYRIWVHMRGRCFDKNNKAFKNYGGRGITVCDRWLDFKNFAEDMLPSYEVHAKKFGEKNTTIDRMNVNGHYDPSNCRWSTYKKQANNTRVQTPFVATNLETGKTYTHYSQKLFAEMVGIPSYHISAVLKGDRKSCYGYTFRYLDKEVN